MSVTYHERPGVYSDFDASSVTAASAGSKVIALAGRSDAAASLYRVTSCAAGLSELGADTELGRMLELAYLNGAGTVLAVPVESDALSAYQAAFDLIFAEKEAAYIVCASGLSVVHTELSTRVTEASEQRCECIGLCGLAASATTIEMTLAAASLNSERMVLVAPGFTVAGTEDALAGWAGAAALAGVLSAQTDPALPLNGAQLRGLTGTSADFDDTTLDTLIRGGITVCEAVGGAVSVIRGITTRTKTNSVADTTYRELNTMLIIDEVLPAIRAALRRKFARAKNNAATRGAIRSQVIVELEDRVAREIIDSYEDVTVTAAADDASTALVEFGFTVTHGLNRICLTAHISV